MKPLAAISSVVAVVTLTAFVALAQHGHHVPPHHGRGDHDKHFAELAAALGLTEQQKAYAKKVHTETLAKAGPFMHKARAIHAELEAMLETPRPDPSELGKRMIEMHASHKQLKALHEQATAKLATQLRPEQRAKLDQLHKKDGHRGLGHCGEMFGAD